MTVIIVERATPGLRGQLTRWMIEVKAGVFVGTLSARVRDKLWTLVCRRNATGGSIMIVSARNEQGFHVVANGDSSRELIDNEGLWLVRKPPRAPVGVPRASSETRAGLPRLRPQ